MAMQRPLDLTLISAKDLKDVNLLTKMDLYAVVSLSVDPNTRFRTPVDHDCGKNPSWNHTVKLHVPEGEGVDRSSIYLQVLIRAEKTLGGDRDVGEVHIPIRELEANAGPGSEPKVATYQVRTSSGKAKGVVNLSYKFGDPVSAPTLAAPPPAPAAAYPPPAGYPPPHSKSGEPALAYPMAAGGSYQPAAGPSAAYPAPPPQAGYGYGAPPREAYPPQGYGGYGYPPPPQQGYGYPPPPAGYPGYAPQVQQPQQKKKNKFGMGLGAGLLGGAIGGLLIGDAIGDAASYDAGYDAGFDDGGGFDF